MAHECASDKLKKALVFVFGLITVTAVAIFTLLFFIDLVIELICSAMLLCIFGGLVYLAYVLLEKRP